jgi:plastocyanin
VNRHRRSLVLWSPLVAALAVLAACGGGGSDEDETSTGPEAGGERVEVVVELLAFEPEVLEVEAGTTVVWEQRDTPAHTIVSGTVEDAAGGVTQQPDGTFESDELATDESFEHRFEEPGTYPYFCSLHPATMRGEVRVS